MSDIDKAIEIVKYSQESHQQWLEWIEWHETNDCHEDWETIIKTAGNKNHHRQCIERYQTVINTLEGLK